MALPSWIGYGDYNTVYASTYFRSFDQLQTTGRQAFVCLKIIVEFYTNKIVVELHKEVYVDWTLYTYRIVQLNIAKEIASSCLFNAMFSMN